MKELKIVKGKLTLEGRVVDAELRGLKIIEVYQQITPKEEVIRKNAPAKANAYIIGKSDSFSDFLMDQDCYPVLYVKIKAKK